MSRRPGLPIKGPQGILRRGGAGPPFRLSLYPPAADLAPFVEHHWVVSWDLRGEAPFLQENLSHPSVHLVFERGCSRVVGVVTGRFGYLLRGRNRVLGVRFRPGGFYPFRPAPLRELTDRTLGLREAFGIDGQALERSILSRRGDAGMVAAAERFLRQRLPPPDPRATLAGDLVARVAADRGITRVPDLARLAHLSPRTLQRLFARYVGAGPKWVIRRYRLIDAAERIAAGGVTDWARVALELGYADQAHLIDDFRTTVGTPPARYARRQRPARGDPTREGPPRGAVSGP